MSTRTGVRITQLSSTAMYVIPSVQAEKCELRGRTNVFAYFHTVNNKNQFKITTS